MHHGLGGGAQQVVGRAGRSVGVSAEDRGLDRAVALDVAHLCVQQGRERLDRRFVGRPQAVEHQPEHDRLGEVDHGVPEGQGGMLAGHGPARGCEVRHCRGDGRTVVVRRACAARGSEAGDVRCDGEPGLDDAARGGGVELTVAHEQPGEQVESGVALEVPHGGRATVAHLDQPGRRHPLERLPDGRTRDPEELGQPTLARQRVAGAERAVDDLAEELLEDVVRDEPPGHGLEDHAVSLGQLRSGGQVV